MNTITYSHARQNLTAVMDTVCNDSETIIITSPKQRVVMMSLDDYNALMETCHLLSTPQNAAHLRQSIEQADAGNFANVTLENL